MALQTIRLIAIAALGLAAVAPVRAADTGPVYVVPTRPGIPVMINGRDASYAIVEGDWGLARPGHMSVTIIGGHAPRASSEYAPRRSYHPRYGRAPERGRNEVEPPPDRQLPPPAESYSRSWSSHTGPLPSYVPPHYAPSSYAPPSFAPSSYATPQPGDGAPRGEPQSFAPGIDIVPPTIHEPQPYMPPIVVVPGRRP
ncbi:MAG: hypothetical protein FJX62_12905 [Alphaproteobacteria bacterium]|nr:hypothetical protein [Alphaproteobacteria bacterium]